MHMPKSFPDPTPCNWSRQEVQSFAADAAKKLGYQPGDEVEKVVEMLGGRVELTDFASAANTGSITVYGPEDFVIALSPLAGSGRSRFTMAHELGHYVLHSKLGKIPLQVRRDGSGRTEWEANWFAAGFLMPEEEIRTKIAEGWGNAELAEHFGVSEAAIEVRRKAL